MPLYANALASVSFKLKVTISSVLCQAFIIVKDPKFGLSVIGTRTKQAVLKR